MARLALLVCSLAVAMAIVELGLRLAHYGGLRAPVPSEEDELRTLHPTRGWALTPGARALVENAEFTVEVAINSRGLRDVEHAPEPAHGQRRIAVLGDSFMEANQVALEKTFARALDRALDGTEVINLGVGGYGSAQQWLALREEGLGYRPDLVLVAFYYNDVRNNSRTLEGWLWGEEAPKVFGRPYARIDASGAVVVDAPDYERARRWAEKRRAKERRRRGPALLSVRQIRALFDAGGELRRHDPNLWLGPLLADFDSGWSAAERSVDAYTAAWEKAWQVTERVLTEIGRTSREAGAEVLVFSVPARFQVEPEIQREIRARYPGLRFDAGAPSRRLAALCLRNDLAFVDLLPAFQRAHAAGEGPLFHQRVDHHWNAGGHALAAREIARHLTSGSGFAGSPVSRR